MERSRLIQRIKKPIGTINPFAFGGGIQNGGFSDTTIDIIQEIWSFDYMGASEFEWGAVPKSLKNIANNSKSLIYGYMKLHYIYIDYNGIKNGNFRVSYICTKEQEKEVKTRLSKWALSEPRGETKELIGLNKSMANSKDNSECCGWLDIENNFMFFTDETMLINTCNLLGIKSPAKQVSNLIKTCQSDTF